MASHRAATLAVVLAACTALFAAACTGIEEPSRSPTSPSIVGASSTPGGTVAPRSVDDKVSICHRTESGELVFEPITISNSAVSAHEAHGDHYPGKGFLHCASNGVCEWVTLDSECRP